jgi:hypothetical protein
VLPPETVEMAKQFYISHEITSITPGKNSYVVTSDGKKVHLQE